MTYNDQAKMYNKNSLFYLQRKLPSLVGDSFFCFTSCGFERLQPLVDNLLLYITLEDLAVWESGKNGQSRSVPEDFTKESTMNVSTVPFCNVDRGGVSLHESHF